MSENWTSRRFVWLSAIMSNEALPDAAKLLASALCCTLVDGDTGQCRRRLEDMAQAIAKDKRTVRRALRTLEAAGWLRSEQATGRGRAALYELALPGNVVVLPTRERGATKPQKADTSAPLYDAERRSDRARKADTSDRPYNNPTISQNARAHATPPKRHFQAVSLTDRDAERIAGWNGWLAAEGCASLALIASNAPSARPGVYQLPSRFPPPHGNAEKRAETAAFFELAYGYRFPSAEAETTHHQRKGFAR
ncbi:helix-turn-helix domain-containing protein [Paroceanicella profunda]|uniref:helix-turn-helix domain-containing protein n=1 Tax=Paroceanicella profunda TaxID=2579971 RepID=UPI00147877DD|nr:helix-turn-helix domain-containing protein [Paroceanicella profunda]